MNDYNNDSDFAPEWLSRDLGVSFEDIMSVFSNIVFDEEDNLDLEEEECNRTLTMILAIR